MHSIEVLVFIIGFTIHFSIFIHYIFHKMGLSALTGYLLLGATISYVDSNYHLLADNGYQLFEFLATLGIISLLFRGGLESKLSKLLGKLRIASFVWIGDITVSWTLGYIFAHSLLKLQLVMSIIVATALSATNVGVSVGVWQEFKILRSGEDRLLIDVAELDDISAIFMLALLVSILPMFYVGTPEALIFHDLLVKIAIFVVKFVLFTLFCVIFVLKIERYLTGFFRSLGNDAELMLVVTVVAFMIATLAGLIGFSVTIGAFFAGLVFSRDPASVNLDASYTTLCELFSPIFFIGIGLNIFCHQYIQGSVCYTEPRYSCLCSKRDTIWKTGLYLPMFSPGWYSYLRLQL